MKRSKPIQPPAAAMAWRICCCRAVVKLSGPWLTACIVLPDVLSTRFTRRGLCNRRRSGGHVLPTRFTRRQHPGRQGAHGAGHRRRPAPRPHHSAAPRAARRLGRSMALALAAAGWQVAVHYRSSAQEAMETVAECEGLSGASASFRADFQDEAAVRALVPGVVRHFGRLDALVNSAWVFEHDSAASFGFAALEKHLRSNTGAPVLLAQALHQHILARAAADEQAQGVVVNLGRAH